MSTEPIKYYCDNSFHTYEKHMWGQLLDYVFEIADQAEFNIMYRHKPIPLEICNLSDDVVCSERRKNKIYFNGVSVKYKLTNQVKSFIKSFEYKDWHNYYYEDIAFLSNNKEIMATITHENYVIMGLTVAQKDELAKLGFNFWCEWPDPNDHPQNNG